MFQLQVVRYNFKQNAKSTMLTISTKFPSLLYMILYGTLTQLYFLLCTSCTRYKWSHTTP